MEHEACAEVEEEEEKKKEREKAAVLTIAKPEMREQFWLSTSFHTFPCIYRRKSYVDPRLSSACPGELSSLLDSFKIPGGRVAPLPLNETSVPRSDPRFRLYGNLEDVRPPCSSLRIRLQIPDRLEKPLHR